MEMKKRGMPLYLDNVPRSISDVAAEQDNSTHDWEPANVETQKLWRCIEALRDIASILEDAAGAKTNEKRRRKAKILFTPLVSLALGILDLLDMAERDPDARRRIGPQMLPLIPNIRERYIAYVPIEKNKVLRDIRNKLSAHVDQSLFPSQARKLYSKADLREVGLWLHVSIAVLLDLLKLPMYGWWCDCQKPGLVRLMTCEPMLVTMRWEDNKFKDLVAFHIVKDTPTSKIVKLMQEVISSSSWMFHKEDLQIRLFARNIDEIPWPESLLLFPKNQGG